MKSNVSRVQNGIRRQEGVTILVRRPRGTQLYSPSRVHHFKAAAEKFAQVGRDQNAQERDIASEEW